MCLHVTSVRSKISFYHMLIFLNVSVIFRETSFLFIGIPFFLILDLFYLLYEMNLSSAIPNVLEQSRFKCLLMSVTLKNDHSLACYILH